MCVPSEQRTDVPAWRRPLARSGWTNRSRQLVALVHAVGIASLLGVLAYQHLRPSDIERAEADLQTARDIVMALDEESTTCQKEARGHKKWAAEFRKRADDDKDTTDAAWLEWHRAAADGNTQLARAKAERRDNLFHLTAQYLRLLAEAECEIVRAKDARDRGTPYKVAPRVRDLLAPILGTR
ncbi:MAG: hypothetical protein K2X91_16540 [Thermoleophilia bacterium]|nr:hypothetical protein [Thermoleophilia bacterium]